MKSKTYFSQDLQHKVLSKHKTFSTHFSLLSGTPVCCGTQFGKHWFIQYTPHNGSCKPTRM